MIKLSEPFRTIIKLTGSPILSLLNAQRILILTPREEYSPETKIIARYVNIMTTYYLRKEEEDGNNK